MNTLVVFFKMFSDPLFRGPLIGGLLMSLSASVVGALAFVRRQALLGEVLSHASYPGVVFGMVLAGIFFPFSDSWALFFIFLGAFLSAFCGQWVLEKLMKQKVKADTALCYTLALFLSFGVLLSSLLQQKHVMWYRKIQMFLYGQAATMTDTHILLYGALSAFIVVFVLFTLRPFAISFFDPIFSYSLGIKEKTFNRFFLFILALSIVIGIRSVGVIMMTGMLVAPAVVAKCLSRRFSSFILVSAFAGALGSFLGSYFSASFVIGEHHRYLPMGPTTVASSCFLALSALLFSPSQGYVTKSVRKKIFQISCLKENILKYLWKFKDQSLSERALCQHLGASRIGMILALLLLQKEGYLQKKLKGYALTEDGIKKASYIVRLHRLWELYLIQYLSSEIERVHQSAEHMEHFITPEIESQLTQLLKDPLEDPHRQPIPRKELL